MKTKKKPAGKPKSNAKRAAGKSTYYIHRDGFGDDTVVVEVLGPGPYVCWLKDGCKARHKGIPLKMVREFYYPEWVKVPKSEAIAIWKENRA